MSSRLRIQVVTPRRLTLARREALLAELRDLTAACFDRVPDYQVVGGDPDAIERAVLAVARDRDGVLLGFTSALVFETERFGSVLHLGLTCVSPDARGLGLTHRLLSTLVVRWVATHRPLTGAWCTNVASVLSSLGNVALHFEDVHPSPYRTSDATPGHHAVAKLLSDHHRARVHLSEDARFDADRFVFVGGNRGTAFAKSAHDAQYHHRDPELTRWYAELADLDNGDAVLQVSRVSLAGFVRYVPKDVVRRIPGLRRLVPRRPRIPALSASVGVRA